MPLLLIADVDEKYGGVMKEYDSPSLLYEDNRIGILDNGLILEE